MSREKAKDAAAAYALELVKEGMHIGLGTGSTAGYFIKRLIAKCRRGFAIRAVATSVSSERIAREGGIPLLDIETISHLDLTVDGADEVDPKRELIKGAGGALVREKIIASMSKKLIIVVDEQKCVDQLGHRLLPVEVVPFAKEATRAQIASLGLSGNYRMNEDGTPFVTDNQNWIFDITFPSPPHHPQELHDKLLHIPAVVDTGFFFNLATTIVVGKPDGTTEKVSQRV